MVLHCQSPPRPSPRAQICYDVQVASSGNRCHSRVFCRCRCALGALASRAEAKSDCSVSFACVETKIRIREIYPKHGAYRTAGSCSPRHPRPGQLTIPRPTRTPLAQKPEVAGSIPASLLEYLQDSFLSYGINRGGKARERDRCVSKIQGIGKLRASL